MKDTLTGMKDKLQGINSIEDEADRQISNLKYQEEESNQNSNKKKISKNENSVRSLWDNFKCTSIHIMW